MTAQTIIFPRGMVRAAGAVAWRPKKKGRKFVPGQPVAPKDFEVLLVHRPRYRDWSWPKGKAERNEPIPVAAAREVEEETGVLVSLGAPLTTQRYRLGSGHLKEVYYWTGNLDVSRAARATRKPVAKASKKEIDIASWMSPDRAREMLTRRGDRRMLTELVNRAARGELITSTTVLLRSADAVDRGKWGETESTRPLSRLGGAQAIDLVPLLSAFGVGRTYTSPWRACSQTVGPYAVIGQGKLSEKDFLTEASMGKDSGPAVDLVRSLLAKKTGSKAVCFHRQGHRSLLTPVREVTPRRLLSPLDQPKANLKKAEMLIAHVTHAASPRVIAIERHRPLTKVSIG